MATITKRGARWQVKIRRFGYPNQTATFAQKCDAERWAHETEHKLDKGILTASADLRRVTFGDLLARYARDVAPRKHGAKYELAELERFQELPIARLSLAALRREHFAALRDEWLTAGNKHTGGPLSPSTVIRPRYLGMAALPTWPLTARWRSGCCAARMPTPLLAAIRYSRTYFFVVAFFMSQQFEWDANKARRNLQKHGVSFELAIRAFSDPLALTVQDRIEDGEARWQTLGMADGIVLLLVAHTITDEHDGAETIRIISARRATSKERTRYEQEARRNR
jgi:uncharacterized DUF497 family protein